ncbi:MAG TPA: glycosyltransferase family 39 protein [Thermoguttaceae bacterium]|nr:glycosyltransferase family 39 protein [Thermoguttaceae bacterium]
MRFWRSLCESPAETFPNRLSGDTVGAVSRRRVLLALLVLVCLVPRVWAALRWNILWADTVTYLEATESLERGDLESAFSVLGLNVYPIILLWLRRLDVDWTAAGEWWSVAMATLAVLPLFGWVRRQFDDRVAAVACLLYALHPKLVAFSPLIIRDPTFWFLFHLTLYLAWRAAVEIRWRLFLAAGAALTLAVHTRSAGWVLLVPVILWPALRVPSAAGRRRRLVLGTMVCVAAIPVSVAVVNATWLRECPRWEMARAAHKNILQRWYESLDEPLAPKPSVLQQETAAPKYPAPLNVPPSGFTLLRKLAVRFVKAYTYVPLLLALAGLWGWRRVFFRRDHQVVSLMALLMLAMIGIRYSQYGLDIRYFLPVVCVSFPWMALGLSATIDWIARTTQRRIAWSPRRRVWLAAGVVVAVVAAGSFDMKTSAGPLMHQRAELGGWILQRFGPNRSIAAEANARELIVYYARGNFVGKSRLSVIRDLRPDLVVLENNPWNRDYWAACSETLVSRRGLRYDRVDEDRLPPGCRDVLVLVRRDEGLANR